MKFKFPEGTTTVRLRRGEAVTAELPREDIDKIFERAAIGIKGYLVEKPYRDQWGFHLDVGYQQMSYRVTVDLDWQKASIESYWGNTQGAVANAGATAEQVEAIKHRWI